MPATPLPSRLPVMAAWFVLLLAAPGLAVKGIHPDGSLDKPTVSKSYFEGEFWTVINALEAYRKSGRMTHRDDSIYTFKYLSVVYAADPVTRAKAESYMFQLIRMVPTIDLLDLYISDSIHSIFLKVKTDFERIEKSKAAVAGESGQGNPPAVASTPSREAGLADAPGRSAAQSRPEAPSAGARAQERKGIRLIIWAPLAIGGAGLATAAYFLVAPGSDGGGQRTPRPVDVSMEWPKEGSR